MTSARRSAHDAPRPPGSIRRMLRWVGSPTGVALLAVALVGGIAAVISYSHMLDWAKANEDAASEWRSFLFPISVDGAIMAASSVLYADSRAGRKADKLAYVIVVTGVLWSIVANIAHDTTGWGAQKSIAAWPPVALALVVEMVFRFIRRMNEQADALAKLAAETRRIAEEQAAEAARLAEEAEARRVEAEVKKIEAEERRRERAEQREREREKAEGSEAEILRLRATGTDGASERPAWLAPDATARQAMEAYLALNPAATGAELDRMVGIPYFNTAEGYGRKVVRKWTGNQESQQEEV